LTVFIASVPQIFTPNLLFYFNVLISVKLFIWS